MATDEASGDPKGRERRAFVWAALVLLVAVVLRFSGLGVKSVWLDEAISLARISGTFGEMLDDVARNDGHPPIYYSSLYLLTWPFRGENGLAGMDRFPPQGISDWTLRFPSAIAGFLTVLVTLLIERRIAPARRFPLATFFLATSAFAIYYSQEARNYSLACLWTTLSSYFLIRAAEGRQPSSRHLVGFATFSVLALYTFYYALFILVPQVVALAALGRITAETWKRWAVSFLVPCAAFAFHLPVIFAMKNRLQAGGAPLGLSFPPAGSWLLAVCEISQGYNPVHQLAGLTGLVLCFALGLMPVVASARSLQGRTIGQRMLPYLFAVPFAVLLVFPFKPHLFESKHLFLLAPIYSLLLAEALLRPAHVVGSTRDRIPAIAGCASAALVLLINLHSLSHYRDGEFIKEDWRTAAALIEKNAGDGDEIAPAPFYVQFPLLRYLSRERWQLRRTSGGAGELHFIVPAGEPRPASGAVWLVELFSPVSFEDLCMKKAVGRGRVPEPLEQLPGSAGTIRITKYVPRGAGQ